MRKEIVLASMTGGRNGKPFIPVKKLVEGGCTDDGKVVLEMTHAPKGVRTEKVDGGDMMVVSPGHFCGLSKVHGGKGFINNQPRFRLNKF